MKVLNRIVPIGAVCASMLGQATAVTVTTAEGNGADTYLSNDEKDGPYAAHGRSVSMEYRHTEASRFRALYVRFDLTAYKGEILSDASITLHGVDVGRDRSLLFMGLLDGATTGQGEAWNEDTLCYCEAAGFSTADAGTFILSGDLTAALAGTSGSVEGPNKTVRSKQLDGFLNADTDGLVTFVVYTTEPWNGTEYFMFETKEAAGGHAPALTFLIDAPKTLGFVL